MEGKIVNGILRRNEQLLRRHLVLSRTVLDKLCSRNVITDRTKTQIMFQDVYEQVPTLIRALRNRSLDMLRKFLAVLRETGHAWLADIMMESKAIDYDELSPRRRQRPSTPPEVSPRVSFHMRDSYDKGKYDNLSVGGLMNPTSMTAPHDTVRGQLKPRFLLDSHSVPDRSFSEHRYHQPQPGIFVPPADSIPHTLYSLNNFFRGQKHNNAYALTALRQEEVAIRQLLEQNSRDQMKVRRSQYAIDEIDKRMHEINVRAADVYDTNNNAEISRYRLAQLNQIPWEVRR